MSWFSDPCCIIDALWMDGNEDGKMAIVELGKVDRQVRSLMSGTSKTAVHLVHDVTIPSRFLHQTRQVVGSGTRRYPFVLSCSSSNL